MEGCWGDIWAITCNKQKNFSWLWKGGRNFLVSKFVICESKKFLSQGVCTLKFLFLEALQDNEWAIICHKQKNFSWMWKGARNFLVENFVICESKKFLSQGVCTLKFLFLEGLQGYEWAIICNKQKNLAGSTTKLEFFYSQKLCFVRVKNFYLRVYA